MKNLKLISILLSYPEPSWFCEFDNMIEYINADQEFTPEQKQKLLEFIELLSSEDVLDSQERYVATFDRGRSVSMLLFEHIHGESRDRGQAMVDLLHTYESRGFELSVSELPDHLTVFLEFLSQCAPEESVLWLSEVSNILVLICSRLYERQNPYSDLFKILCELGGITEFDNQTLNQVKLEPRDDTPDALDKVWEEEAVRFVGNNVMGGVPASSDQQSINDLTLKSIS
ncbi:MAG TPA: nitrate reductase molybdenum cofactor assembly chaperone [Gammaproteobacteria bacterium]|nr:nitrate reductase molybdenum cofactor assembly chaperone [Gammaproteobacteria bacterium]